MMNSIKNSLSNAFDSYVVRRCYTLILPGRPTTVYFGIKGNIHSEWQAKG